MDTLLLHLAQTCPMRTTQYARGTAPPDLTAPSLPPGTPCTATSQHTCRHVRQVMCPQQHALQRLAWEVVPGHQPHTRRQPATLSGMLWVEGLRQVLRRRL